jgi:hypothetical protein
VHLDRLARPVAAQQLLAGGLFDLLPTLLERLRVALEQTFQISPGNLVRRAPERALLLSELVLPDKGRGLRR